MNRSTGLALIVILLGIVSCVVFGQELERTSGESTDWWWYSNASVEVIAGPWHLSRVKLHGMTNNDCRLTNCGCRFALLFLTNKIERIPSFDIRQSTFDICHAGVSFTIRLDARGQRRRF